MSAPTNVSSDSGSDALDLASSIGTWVAAALAIIALVGVVAPFLALQASLSDSNRAMNAVQDLQQKYVTRGYRLTKGLRVLRRIRVPDLSPGYIANEPDTTRLVPLRAAIGRWTLRPRNYLPWNTGWAKLAELIEAYEVRETAGNSLVDLGVPKGGTLEVVNSRTALTVNKHWILALGLLGRYGKRADKGVLQHTGIRRDIEGERASIRHFELDRKEKTVTEPEFEWVRKKQRKARRSWSPSSGYSRSSAMTSSEREDHTSEAEVYFLQRGAYGTWTLKQNTMLKIHGVTGTMEALGRHKGSWSHLTSISFVPHTAREIFAPGALERSDGSSMQTLFWLAHGFLPCGQTLEGKQTVISLESPAREADSDGMFRELDPLESWPAFSLQEADDIPVSIGNAMKCLGIQEPKVLQFLPLDATGLRDLRQRAEKGEASKDATASSKSDEDESVSSGRITLRVNGLWVHYAKEAANEVEEDVNMVFPRRDLERPISVLLGLDWDDWGFLIRKEMFWVSVLKNAIGIIDQDSLRGPAFANFFGLKSHMKAFRWRLQSSFHSQKLADYLAFDTFLSSSVQGSEVMPLRLALGTLFVIDDSFRRMVEKVCERMSEDDLESEEEGLSAAQQLAKANELREALAKCEKGYRERAEQKPDLKDKDPISSNAKDGEVNPTRPLWTRLSLKHIELETLRVFAIDYQEDTLDSSFVLVKRWVPDWEQDKLWEHTSLWRQLVEMKREEEAKEEKQVPGVLEYDYLSKRLKWYLDEQSKTSYRQWYLNGDLVRPPSAKKNVSLAEREIVLVGLWAANRAAIWLSSQDSGPLLELVEELDPYVYVL